MNQCVMDAMSTAQRFHKKLAILPTEYDRDVVLRNLFGEEIGISELYDIMKEPELQKAFKSIFIAFGEYNKAREAFVLRKFTEVQNVLLEQLPSASP